MPDSSYIKKKGLGSSARRRRSFLFYALDKSDNTYCQHCRSEFSFNDTDDHGSRILTIDHIVPLARGGDDSYDNYMILCKECNLSKASMTYDEFICMKNYIEKGYGLSKKELYGLLDAFIAYGKFKRRFNCEEENKTEIAAEEKSPDHE